MIKTKRLTLRAPVLADAPALTAALQDMEIVQWLTGPPFPFTQSHAEDFIARNQSAPVFVIEDKDGLCGSISLTNGLGYWLIKNRWGRGYMTEAAKAVIALYFDSDEEELESGHVLGNAASRAILLRFGFIDSHIISAAVPARGVDMDVQKMRLDRSTWEARA